MLDGDPSADPSTPAESHGIRVIDVSCDLGERRVLHDINLTIPERRVAIVGRNGSGKTTLFRTIAGLQKPQTGRVEIDGITVAKDRKGAIRTVGLLFQNPDQQIIFPTVGEELCFGLRQLGLSKAQAAEKSQAILVRYNRAHWFDRPVTQLSQGQRHLVCLMAVLLMEPTVILLDEPFSGLDIPTTRALRRHLQTLPQRLVQITHDPDALRGYERLIWIEEGRILQDGPVETVLPAYLQAMNAEEGDQDAGTDLFD